MARGKLQHLGFSACSCGADRFVSRPDSYATFHDMHRLFCLGCDRYQGFVPAIEIRKMEQGYFSPDVVDGD